MSRRRLVVWFSLAAPLCCVMPLRAVETPSRKEAVSSLIPAGAQPKPAVPVKRVTPPAPDGAPPVARREAASGLLTPGGARKEAVSGLIPARPAKLAVPAEPQPVKVAKPAAEVTFVRSAKAGPLPAPAPAPAPAVPATVTQVARELTMPASSQELQPAMSAGGTPKAVVADPAAAPQKTPDFQPEPEKAPAAAAVEVEPPKPLATMKAEDVPPPPVTTPAKTVAQKPAMIAAAAPVPEAVIAATQPPPAVEKMSNLPLLPPERGEGSQVAPPEPGNVRKPLALSDVGEELDDVSLAEEVAAVLSDKPVKIARPTAALRPRAVRLPSEQWLLKACEGLKSLPEEAKVVEFQKVLARYKQMRAAERRAREAGE